MSDEADKLKADAKFAARVALLARSCGCDEATAVRKATPLKYLTDAEFQAHADYLADIRADLKRADDRLANLKKTIADAAKVQLVPRQTSLPCPVGETPRPVQRVDDADARRQKVQADVAAYIGSEFFGDEPDGDGSVRYFADKDEAKASDPQDENVSLDRAVAEYMADVFGTDAEQEE